MGKLASMIPLFIKLLWHLFIILKKHSFSLTRLSRSVNVQQHVLKQFIDNIQ